MPLDLFSGVGVELLYRAAFLARLFLILIQDPSSQHDAKAGLELEGLFLPATVR